MNIFEIPDKTGRKIRLTKKQWSHITSPSSPHAYMKNYLKEIEQTLGKPDKILNSIYDERKASYYTYYKKKNNYLRVLVKYLNGEGFIITAYFIKNIRK